MQKLIVFLLVVGVVVAAAALGGRNRQTGIESEDDDAGTVWGAVAAWLLGVAGVTAVWNLLRRRYVLVWLRGRKAAMQRLMLVQRRLVQPAHAVSGVLALAFGVVHGILMRDHWLLWASMVILGFMVVGGALLQWKWTPATVRKGVYLLHAQQLLFVALVVLLLVGHALVGDGD